MFPAARMKATARLHKTNAMRARMQTLVAVLQEVGKGKPTRVFPCPDGTRVLVLPDGGRVLGLFSAGCDDPFCWTHPARESVDAARPFHADNQWHNSGGDRTWLACDPNNPIA